MQPADPWRFPRQELADHFVQLLLDAPRRPLAVFGPRQTGKTYFINHDLAAVATAEGMRPIYVDLWTQPDPQGTINTAFAMVLRTVLSEARRTAVTGVGAMGVNVGLAAPAALSPASDPSAWMSLQFAELRRLEPKRPVLLMLDEAQTLGKGVAGDTAMKAVRGLFNAYPGGLLLLLTGSSKTQLLSLVGDHFKTALFWIADQPTMVLAAALEAFMAKSRPDAAFAQQYAACTPLQREVLDGISRGEQLFSAMTRRQIARSLGLGVAIAPSTLATAVTALETRGILSKVARGRYRLEDERFGAWLDERGTGKSPG